MPIIFLKISILSAKEKVQDLGQLPCMWPNPVWIHGPIHNPQDTTKGQLWATDPGITLEYYFVYTSGSQKCVFY